MNDQLIALIRTVWTAVISSAISYLLTLGIEIDSSAAFAVTWPIVLAVWYAVSAYLARRVPKLSILNGPGSAPTYGPATYEEAIEMATGK